MATLSYDSRDGNYHVVVDGRHLVVDGDAYAEAMQTRIRDGMAYRQAEAETLDAAGWEEGMAGVSFLPLSIAERRAALGMSQTQLAGALDISVDTLQNWEQGRRTPRSAGLLEQALVRLEETR